MYCLVSVWCSHIIFVSPNLGVKSATWAPQTFWRKCIKMSIRSFLSVGSSKFDLIFYPRSDQLVIMSWQTVLKIKVDFIFTQVVEDADSSNNENNRRLDWLSRSEMSQLTPRFCGAPLVVLLNKVQFWADLFYQVFSAIFFWGELPQRPTRYTASVIIVLQLTV